MTKGNKQNGRQPPVSQVSAPSTDPRCKNASALSSDREKICRDFIWGICIKGARCAYRHERDLDHMKIVLKFCHDFQNKNGCVRPDCTYLHTTRDEQNQFLNKGRIPKVLAERYAAMAAASGCGNEIAGQMTINGGSIPMQSDIVIPMHGMARKHPQTAPFPQLLLQPPPPPPPSSTVVTTTVQVIAQKISTTTKPQVPKVMLNKIPPKIPPIFDLTRPPPQILQKTTGTQKRSADSIEAGSSKARKQEAPNVIETLCDNCVQRELRIEVIHDDNQKLQTQKDCKVLLLEKNNEEYEHAKLIMKPLVKPELYQILEEYLEKLPADLAEPEDLLEMNPTSSPVAMSSSAKALMKHLLDRVITNGNNNLLNAHPMPNGISEDTNVSALSTSAKLTSGGEENSAVELIQSLLFIYKGSIDTTPDNVQTIDSSLLDKLTSASQPSTSGMSISVISELTQYLNGHSDQSLQVVKANGVSAPTGVISLSHSNTVENGPNAIVPFQPTVPPPAVRPMFPPPGVPITANISKTLIPNTMVPPPSTLTMRPSTPIMRPPPPIIRTPTLTIPPKSTKQSPVPFPKPALTVRPPSKPTLAIHSPTPMVRLQSPKPQMHPPPAAIKSSTPSTLPVTIATLPTKPKTTTTTLSATPTKQTPSSTVQPPVTTIQSSVVTKAPPTLAKQSTPMQVPVNVQGPKVTQDSTVAKYPKVATPLSSQQLGPAKHFRPQNGKIIVHKNGRIPPRPHMFPPFL